MIGKDENSEEQPVLKVTDRRKFNPDGSVREGVVIEPEKPKAEEKSAVKETAAPQIKDVPEAETAEKIPSEIEEIGDDDDIPGADDPASFINFLTTLATNAVASLGAMPHPATGQRSVDLETGKYWIDVLTMLRDKTDGNLHHQEKRLLDTLLSDLQMQYVALVRATEEKLKQQAAQKFSASDILGKK
jgi:hypothetical protein